MSEKSVVKVMAWLAVVCVILAGINVILQILMGRWVFAVLYTFVAAGWAWMASLYVRWLKREARRDEEIDARIRADEEEFMVLREQVANKNPDLLDEMIRQADWYRAIQKANEEDVA